jgi:membrane protease YdiL (CAAX protease family)
VLSAIALVAWLTGAVNLQSTDWSKTLLELGVNALVTFLLATVTEDGFFRGCLWASLKRAGLNEQHIVLVTGIAFGVWHLPYTLLTAGYSNVAAEAPLLIINASILGIALGLLRLHSGSVLVPAAIHGIWNGAVYGLFNFGGDVGVLGIQNVTIFGPEAGVLAVLLNLGYTIGLWWWYGRTVATRAVPAGHSQPEPMR